MPKISVIIPIYNAEAYIERAINSILGQTLMDLEVIAVNDGSSDRSGEILKKVALVDRRLKIISKQNEGVSRARQAGVDIASGEYVIHCDADDFMDSDILQRLYDSAVRYNADIVICDYFKDNVHGNGRKYISQRPECLEPKMLQRQLFHRLHGSLCNKLIRLNLLHTSDAPEFTPGIRCKEDWLLLQQLLDKGNLKVIHIPAAGYHYVTNPDSITMSSHDRVKNLTNDISIITALEKLEAINDTVFAHEVASKKIRVKFDMIISRTFTRRQILDRYPEVNSLRLVLGCTLPLKIRVVMSLFFLRLLPL